MITVACVWKTGGDFDDYGHEYVDRLRKACATHLKLNHNFRCLTDAEDSLAGVCETASIQHCWPGWWSKVELFAHFTGPTIYFDLDTIIKGDITPLAEFVQSPVSVFAMINDVGRYTRPASGVMAWKGDFSWLTENFDPDVAIPFYSDAARGSAGGPWGDGGYIDDCLGPKPEILQEHVPGMIVSYKGQSPEERKDAAIVCYHGPPRPHETGWAP